MTKIMKWTEIEMNQNPDRDFLFVYFGSASGLQSKPKLFSQFGGPNRN